MAPRLFQASFHIVTFCLVAGQSIKYGLKGQEVKLNPELQGQQQPDQILWLHNGNKVVEFDGNEEIVYRTFKNRITLNWHSAELHLTDLTSEDSGEYELEVYRNQRLYLYIHNLQVIDTVAKPTITCETNTTDSSTISALLTCSTAQPDVEYEWLFYGNTQPGPQLRIFLGGKLDERMYSCRVSNPLSNETAVFTAKDCCSGICAGESSLVLAVVLPIVLLLLLLVVAAAILIYKRRHKDASLEEGRGGMKPSGTTQGLENSNVPLLNASSQSHNYEVVPLLGQPRDEDDEGSDLVSTQTEKEDQLDLKEPNQDQAETEPSDPESSAAESDADDNKEQLQTPPRSPEHDEQPAPPNDSILGSSGHDDGEQIRHLTPVPRSTEGRHRSEGENSEGEGEEQSVMQILEPGSEQETPVKDHRNHLGLENGNIHLQNVSLHSRNHEKDPLLGQRGNDEDDKGADLVSTQTEKEDQLDLKEPNQDQAETEPSDSESSAAEPDADDNKEQLQTPPRSPEQDEQPAPPNDSIHSSGHDHGEQIQHLTPVPRSTEGRHRSEGENLEGEGEEQSVMQILEPGSEQETPVKDHRNHLGLENGNIPLQNVSLHSRNHEKDPLLGQRGNDEDDKGADLVSTQTEKEDQLDLKEPNQDQAETEPSDSESSAAEPDADDNKEQLQTPPRSPEHDEQPAPPNDSILGSSGHDDGEQIRHLTPVPRSTEGRHRSEGENSEGEGEEQSVMQILEPGSEQETPVKDHRNHLGLENGNIHLQNVSLHSRNHEKDPLLGQRGNDEDDKGADLVSTQTEKEDQLDLKEPNQDQAETEPSDSESSAAEPGADDNKEQLQTPPRSPEQDEQPAPPNDSIHSSGHDDGEQIQHLTPVPRSTEGRHRSEGENSEGEGEEQSVMQILEPGSEQETPVKDHRNHLNLDKDENVQSIPLATSSPYPNSANVVSEDAAGEDREVSIDQSMEELYPSFKDARQFFADGTGQTATYVTGINLSQCETVKETRPPASSGETELNKEDSADSGDKENV